MITDMPTTPERRAFEDWIGGPPYERDIARWHNDEAKCQWPGQYKDNTVQIAWEAWNERPWHL